MTPGGKRRLARRQFMTPEQLAAMPRKLPDSCRAERRQWRRLSRRQRTLRTAG